MKIKIVFACSILTAILVYMYIYIAFNDSGTNGNASNNIRSALQNSSFVYNDKSLNETKAKDTSQNVFLKEKKYTIQDSSFVFNDKSLNETKAKDTSQNVFLTEKKYTIVVYNPKPWYPFESFNNTLKTKCPYRNCRISFDRSNLIQQSAIMFDGNAPELLPQEPPISPSRRTKDQVWIISLMEHPTCHSKDRWGIYKNDQWRNTFNWTWSYTSDSDIPTPLGYIQKRTERVNKNYTAIFHQKTKMAAWVVSHCNTDSKREVYVRKLQEQGITVDVYGACDGGRVDGKEIQKIIDKQYKFYLAFENSYCKEYVTEKLFTYFKLNVVLVVRGGADYNKLVSSDAIINTADFETVEDIAKHLKAVASNETRYTNYLRNKDKFQSFSRSQGESFCHVCEKLNNLDKHRKVYTNLVEKINNGTCFNPKHIE